MSFHLLDVLNGWDWARPEQRAEGPVQATHLGSRNSISGCPSPKFCYGRKLELELEPGAGAGAGARD